MLQDARSLCRGCQQGPSGSVATELDNSVMISSGIGRSGIAFPALRFRVAMVFRSKWMSPMRIASMSPPRPSTQAGRRQNGEITGAQEISSATSPIPSCPCRWILAYVRSVRCFRPFVEHEEMVHVGKTASPGFVAALVGEVIAVPSAHLFFLHSLSKSFEIPHTFCIQIARRIRR